MRVELLDFGLLVSRRMRGFVVVMFWVSLCIAVCCVSTLRCTQHTVELIEGFENRKYSFSFAVSPIDIATMASRNLLSRASRLTLKAVSFFGRPIIST